MTSSQRECIYSILDGLGLIRQVSTFEFVGDGLLMCDDSLEQLKLSRMDILTSSALTLRGTARTIA